MSNNPQWKSFQPSNLNSDPAILDFKSYSVTTSGHNSTPKSYRNGSFNDFSSPTSNRDSSKQYFSYPSNSSPPLCSSGASGRFPIGTFSLDNPSGGGGGGGGSGGGAGNGQNNQATSFNSSGDSGTIGVFANSNNSSGGGANSSFGSSSGGGANDSSNQGTRETGIIEKLLHSYGFIQCCERQARLFFHFSQFSGNIEHLKIGDPVEFEMTYDRRTGKPIASTVSKIAPEVASPRTSWSLWRLTSPPLSPTLDMEANNMLSVFANTTPPGTPPNTTLSPHPKIIQPANQEPQEIKGSDISIIVQKVLSEERVTGNVTTELRTEGSGDTQGRISYENRGECFFLPYTKDDVEGNVTLRSGDKVSFQIATNQRGNLGACHVRLENPAHPVLYRGVVCSMKESFGFIERADVVKEIFFHFSEAKTTEELRPGDDVEFIILTRNGKEVACNITRLPPGSVIFEDVNPDITKGQVLKPLDRGTGQRHQNDPLPGRIRYRAPDHSEVEVPFGDKDQKGDFTLRHGDWVQFQLATDRRDQLQRASSISLLDESFVVSGERRDQGIVVALKDGFGFLRCVEREPRLFFHFTEVLDVNREICMGDEVEFTAIQDPTSSFANLRHSAIRIKHLPPGTVKFETLVESNLNGVVTREASPRSPSKTQNGTSQQNGVALVPEGGMISYQSNGQKKSVPFFAKDCDRQPRIGDKVEFNICQVKRNKELIATDVVVTAISNQSSNHSFNGSSSASSNSSSSQTGLVRNGVTKNGRQSLSNGQLCQGFVAALKDGFGFIETIAHDKEVFFHFSNFEGDTTTLDLGQEVEYILAPRGSNGGGGSGSCCSAENVRTIARGSISLPEGTGDMMNGVVTRPLRSVNPDQNEYSGLIQVTSEDGEKNFEFGITGLSNKRDLLQNGDPVTLRVDTEGRATEVTAMRKKRRATVDAIKGLFGFLAYEVEEGKKLFFHMSEVEDGVQLQQGDTVEFALVTNQRSGKSSACNVVKVTDVLARPERLISRLRVSSLEESGPRLTVSRQPKGPDGSQGFHSSARLPRKPGVIPE